MGARFRYLVYLVRSSFWFLPGTLLLGAVGLSFLTVAADESVLGTWLRGTDWLFHFEERGARTILSTIAGSMITVTSLVYSLMLVAMTLASGQLGPRLLTMFMRDRLNQMVLGLFLATFVFSLMVLTTIGPAEDGGAVFIPSISVLAALLLSLSCCFLLVFFIHHVADGIQADAIIADVGIGLDAEIDSLFPPDSREARDDRDADRGGDAAAPPEGDEGREIAVRQSGYLQTVDYPALAELCEDHDAWLALEAKPGDFLVAGHRIGLVRPSGRRDEAFDDAVRGALVTGPKRTPAQDLGFRVHALVEVALRALSPGINDTRTAIACVDRLTASLARMMDHRAFRLIPEETGGNARLTASHLEFEDICDIAFDEIRQSARSHPVVIFRQIDSLVVLAAQAGAEGHRAVILKHGKIMERLCKAVLDEPVDRETARKKLKRLWQALAGEEAPAVLVDKTEA